MPRNCAHFCPESLLISLNLCYVSSRPPVSLRNSIPMLPIYGFWRASLHFRANIQGNFPQGFLPQCLLITLNSEQTFGESTSSAAASRCLGLTSFSRFCIRSLQGCGDELPFGGTKHRLANFHLFLERIPEDKLIWKLVVRTKDRTFLTRRFERLRQG